MKSRLPSAPAVWERSIPRATRVFIARSRIKVGGGSDQAAPPQIVVVQHWTEELKRLVPTN
jgi:hypothetical protein